MAEFDEKVVFTDNAPDASEYRKYYEEISPDNAEKIYRQVVKSERSTEKAKELATYYSNMEAASAAQTLQEMKEDLDLVCDIIENMPEKRLLRSFRKWIAHLQHRFLKRYLPSINNDRCRYAIV